MSFQEYECSDCGHLFAVDESRDRNQEYLSGDGYPGSLACPACGCGQLLQLVPVARRSRPTWSARSAQRDHR